MPMHCKIVPVLLTLGTLPLAGQRLLVADGTTPAYTLIRGVLGANAETPDCAHPDFGPHITQAQDEELGKHVFVFHMHVTPDNDRCIAFDRQRLEIKTDGGSPSYLKASLNEAVTYRWRFRLPAGFKPTNNFTHIHQLKPGDGDADMPIVTLTARKGTPDRMQVIWSDGAGGHGATPTEVPLAPFLGAWVEAFEQVTFGRNGTFSLVVKRLRDGATLLSYRNTNIDLWRAGTSFVRPKWGIYRSLNSIAELRDEQVRFDRFCLSKGADPCAEEEGRPALALKVTPASHTLAPGGSATYELSAAGNPVFSVAGLPEGATAAFSGTTLTLTTSGTASPGSYTLLINAETAALSSSVTAGLVLSGGAAAPAITSVVNGASMQPGVAAGGWISVFGRDLAETSRPWREGDITDGKLPVQLDGSSVTFDGKPAAIAYVSPSQLNVEAPGGILAGIPVLVRVSTPRGAASAAVELRSSAPALFTSTAGGVQYAAALHAAGFAVIDAVRPAQPGESIIVYGTGFGATNPALASGRMPARPAALVNSAAVWIGGQPAELLWAGLVAPGLYQLNVRVPAAAPAGDLPIATELEGASTQDGVFLAVR